MTRLVFQVSFVVLALSTAVFAQPGTPNQIPEIDAGSAASALTLIAGATMFLKDKLRAK